MINRPVASLSPTLLARKGAARPAMRPQLPPLRSFQDVPHDGPAHDFAAEDTTARQLEDLGWNDMGPDADRAPVAPAAVAAAPAPVVVETPMVEPVVDIVETPRAAEVVALNSAIAIAAPSVPEIVHQQAEIAERVIKARRSALSDGRRAAFTLRLDSDRHLKLRLACVTSNRSAQQLVTEALDRLIADLPDVAELAAKVRKSR